MNLDMIRSAAAADVPLMLWGPPGIGKTARIAQAAADAGAHLEVLVGSQCDPTDIAGLPVQLPGGGGGGVRLAPPAWAVRIRAALDAGTPAWLLLDELASAPPSVRAAMLRVVQERQVGDIDLRGVRVFAAGNAADHAADGGDLDAATANRLIHVQVGAEPDLHLPGILAGWGRPQADGEPAARAAIVDFLRARPGALCAPPSGPVGPAGAAWPSPRSWDALARLVAAGLPWTQAAPAAIGTATACELSAYLAARDLPTPAALLAGDAQLPARGDRALAAWEGVVAHVLGLPAAVAAQAAAQAAGILTALRRRDLRVQLARVAVAAADAARKPWPGDLSAEVAHAQDLAR